MNRFSLDSLCHSDRNGNEKRSGKKERERNTNGDRNKNKERKRNNIERGREVEKRRGRGVEIESRRVIRRGRNEMRIGGVPTERINKIYTLLFNPYSRHPQSELKRKGRSNATQSLICNTLYRTKNPHKILTE